MAVRALVVDVLCLQSLITMRCGRKPGPALQTKPLRFGPWLVNCIKRSAQRKRRWTSERFTDLNIELQSAPSHHDFFFWQVRKSVRCLRSAFDSGEAQVLLVTSNKSAVTIRLHMFMLVRVLTRARGHSFLFSFMCAMQCNGFYISLAIFIQRSKRRFIHRYLSDSGRSVTT